MILVIDKYQGIVDEFDESTITIEEVKERYKKWYPISFKNFMFTIE